MSLPAATLTIFSICTISILAVTITLLRCRTQRLKRNPRTAGKKFFQIYQHRARGADFPDNSLEGMQSLAQQGIQGIEIDVWMTQDGVLVVTHDAELSVHTTGAGCVYDTSWLELKHHTLIHGGSPTAYQIPTLEAVLRWAVTNEIYVDIELKKFPKSQITQAIQQLVSLIQKHHGANYIWVTSLQPSLLYLLRKLAPNICTGLLISDLREDNPWWRAKLIQFFPDIYAHWIPKYLGVDAILPPHRWIQQTPHHLEHWKQQGFYILPWTWNDPVQRNKQHPFGYITDLPPSSG